METLMVRIDCADVNEEQIKRAGWILKSGGLVAFPTETVYGLGGDALNGESSGKIYAAKGRPSDNPLIVHIARLNDLKKIAARIPGEASLLAERFWPGPLTMIFPKKEIVPLKTTGGLCTVAVRMPAHPVALALIEAAGGFVAAPSANSSGRPSPTEASHVAEDLNGRIDMILDGGPVGIGLESTIVDMTGRIPVILRPGFLTEETLREAVGEVETDPAVREGNRIAGAPKAPGMKYRHYAPKGRLFVVRGRQEDVVRHIDALAALRREEGYRVGILAADETAGRYQNGLVVRIGSRQNGRDIARRLFGALREFDRKDVAFIYSEAFDTEEMGQAIMNRLLKAAGQQIINV